MRRSLLIVMTTAALALSACGSSNKAAPAGNLSANDIVLASQTTGTTSAHVVTTAVATVNGDESTFKVDGAFDMAAKRGDFNVTVPAIRGFNIGELPARFIDDTFYVKTPAMLQRATGGKAWTRIDAATLSALTGKPVDAIERPLVDPAQNLGVLEGATSSTVVGTEKVRGDDTTHYRVEVDLNAAADKAAGEQQSHLQQLAKLYANKPLPVDVWVDDQNRVRKVSYSVDSTQLDINAVTTTTAPLDARFTVNAEFYDFGTAVNVVAPSADEVMDPSQLTAVLRSFS